MKKINVDKKPSMEEDKCLKKSGSRAGRKNYNELIEKCYAY